MQKIINNAFQRHLDELGLPSETIEYSLNGSSEDYVVFYGKLDIPKYILKNKLGKKFRACFNAGRKEELVIALCRNHSIDKPNSYFYVQMNSKSRLYQSLSTSEAKWRTPMPLTLHLEKHIAEVSKELKKIGYTIRGNKCLKTFAAKQ